MLLRNSTHGQARWGKLRFAFLTAMLAILAQGQGTTAQTPIPHSYTETFETTTAMDPTRTTATWDTDAGVATLPMEVTPLGTLVTATSCLDVCVSGNYSLVAARTGGLLVVDTTNPASPTVVGTYDNTRDIKYVEMDGDHAVIVERATLHSIGFWRIIDISDPTNPVSVGSPSIWSHHGQEVAIEGDLCLMPGAEDGLTVIDITDVTAPAIRPNYSTSGSILGVAIQGRYAYVVGSDNFEVLDISNPATVARVGFLASPDGLQVAVAGFHAYVVTSGGELRVFDVADPASPTLIATVPAPGARDISVNGNWAYVAAGDDGLLLVDISDPTLPVTRPPAGTGGYANRCRVEGNVVHVANGSGGYRTFTVANLLTPPEYVATYNVPDDASDVAISGDLAFVTEYGDAGLGQGSLRIVDISDPGYPSTVSVFNGFIPNNKAVAVAVASNRAFVLTDYEGSGGIHSSVLHTIDVSDPENPIETDSIGFAANAKAQYITLRDNYAYCGCKTTSVSWGVIIIDVGDPDNLSVAGHASTLDRDVTDIELFGNSMHLAEPRGSTNEHFQVLDLTNPTAPSAAWNGYLGYGIDDLCVSGNHVCATGPGFIVFDISNPFAPTWAGYISPSNGNFRCLAQAGRYVAVDMDIGFAMVDLHTPTSPILLADVDHSGNISKIVVEGNYAFGASSDVAPGSYSGLMVFRVFEHGADTSRNRVASLDIDSSPLNIYGARLTADAVGSITWYLSADGGTWWDIVSPGDDWHLFQHTGSHLRWQAYLYESAIQPWPVIETVTIEWHHTDITGVGDRVPDRYTLHGATPNPFNARTTISFDVPVGGGNVALEIYNVRGQLVRRLTSGFHDEGRQTVPWDGRDDRGRQMAGGTYYCRLNAEGFVESSKLTLAP